MNPRRWSDCLQPIEDMLENVEAGLSISRGRSMKDLREDIVYRMAILHIVQTIGEAARRIHKEARDLAPEIPWNRIVGARSVIVHEYDKLRLEVVQEVLENHLVLLREPLLQLKTRIEKLGDARLP